MLKINAILIGLNFFIRNGNRWFRSLTLIFYRHFDTEIIFNTELCFKIYSIKHWKLSSNKFKCLYILWKIAQLYYECSLGTSPKKWDTKLGVTHTHDVLSVYCWHIIFFDLFFHNTDVCIFATSTALFHYVHSYKTNPLFLPCKWNLRSIGPSDFKFFLPSFSILIYTLLRVREAL